MADPETLLAGLHGLRLPGIGVGDLAVALGLGLLLGAAAFGPLRLALRTLLAPEPLPEEDGAEARIAALRQLPRPERVLGLARELKALTDRAAPAEGPEAAHRTGHWTGHWTARAAERFGLDPAPLAALRAGLYAPQPPQPPGPPDPDALEAALRKALAQAG